MIRADLRADAPTAMPEIASLLEGQGAFTNFEAAVVDPKRGQTVRDGRFASPAGAMESLAEVGFNLLALANNHSFDLGSQGIMATVDTAKQLNVTHAGTGKDMESANAMQLLETPGGRVALIAVASGLVLDGRAADGWPGVNELGVVGAVPDQGDALRILRTVEQAREEADLVVVSHHNHHYPGVELPRDFKQFLLSELPERLSPPNWLESWARRLVDAGADVVAGHGPPFLHGMEIYRGKPIFYSLGNFIFQVPPESIHLEEPIMWESVVAYAEFQGRDLVGLRLQPIAMNKVGLGLPNPHDEFDVNQYHRTRGLPTRAVGAQARYLLERLARLSAAYGTAIRIDDEGAVVELTPQAATT
jgi:poly-gamma-glutamate synthesis protein (capsule biosynthesis protein)